MTQRYSIVGTDPKFTGLPESFLMQLQPGESATLVREPTNPFDPNAVSVWIKGKRVGYVPRKQNTVLARFIDANGGPAVDMAQDGSMTAVGLCISGTFVRSPNSGFPMVEV